MPSGNDSQTLQALPMPHTADNLNYKTHNNEDILQSLLQNHENSEITSQIYYDLVNSWSKSINYSNNVFYKKKIKAIINWLISAIDEIVNQQLNEIIHHPSFQKIESSWRGIEYLVNQCEYNNSVKIKVLDITWKEISKDISKAIEFDQSTLFSKIYSEEYGLPGGEPYGIILADYEISHKPVPGVPYDTVSTLEVLGSICAAAFSPLITAASAELFGLNHYTELSSDINIEAIFKSAEYIKWNKLRQKPDSRFIGLTLPHYLARKPYCKITDKKYNLLFDENLDTENSSSYCWGNSCYVFGAVIIREFINVGWFGHIRGVPRGQLAGGLVTNTVHCNHKTDNNGIAIKYNTDVLITDSMEKKLSDLGFIPLCQCYGTEFSAFYSNQSLQSVSANGRDNRQINNKLSTMLQHILCGSRIAHYLKVIIRDKVGSFMTAIECEHFLQDWLHNYTTGREDLEWDEQARYPLREARVTVKENPAKAGIFSCVIYLRPHYQLDNMISELELVTELASPNSAGR